MLMKLGAAFVFGSLFGAVMWGLGGQGATEDPTPIGPRWWPSEWGPGDQRGAANRLTAERAKQASRLIRDGKVYSLGRLYEYGMPMPGKRHFSEKVYEFAFVFAPLRLKGATGSPGNPIAVR